MSRWWPEPIAVAPPDVADAASSVDSVLASFGAELDLLQPRHGARIACIVGGEAVRLRVVPWSDALTGAVERRVLASQCFVEAFGEAASTWAVREHAVRHGEATLAAALDPALLDGLAALSRARGLHLSSVQPAFMHAFNVRREALDSDLGWFVWVERHVTTALLFSPRAPRLVKRWTTPHAELASLLAREQFALGIDEVVGPAWVERAAHAASIREALPA